MWVSCGYKNRDKTLNVSVVAQNVAPFLYYFTGFVITLSSAVQCLTTLTVNWGSNLALFNNNCIRQQRWTRRSTKRWLLDFFSVQRLTLLFIGLVIFVFVVSCANTKPIDPHSNRNWRRSSSHECHNFCVGVTVTCVGLLQRFSKQESSGSSHSINTFIANVNVGDIQTVGCGVDVGNRRM